MNSPRKQRQTHRRRIVVAKGEGRRGRNGVEVWDQQVQSIIHRMDIQDTTL